MDGETEEEIGTLCRVNWIFVVIVRGFGVWILKENYCKKKEPWGSLVDQWLRLLIALQEAWVQSLVGEPRS